MRSILRRAIGSCLRSIALLVVATPPLAAQIRFAESATHLLPQPEQRTADAVAADFDGDGDIDLVRSLVGARDQLLLKNDGTGVFSTAPHDSLPQFPTTAMFAAGDVDGDGDVDLVVGFDTSGSSQTQLYLNDGGGTFRVVTPTHMPRLPDAPTDLALCDVDGDRDLDLVVTNNGPKQQAPYPDRLLLNDGSGRFRERVGGIPINSDLSAAIACGDVEGDGDLDLVFANTYPGQNSTGREADRLYINLGNGWFIDSPAQFPAPTESTTDVAFGDVDRDGDLDLVTTSWGQGRLFLNNGAGTFRDASSSHLPATARDATQLILVDMDRDGALDIVYGRRWFEPGPFRQNQAFRNTGNGVFVDVTASHYPVHADATTVLLSADFSGDGWPDLFVGSYGPAPVDQLYLNDRSGRWVDRSRRPLDTNWHGAQALATVDIDGDGDLDLAAGDDGSTYLGAAGAPNRLYLNDGRGYFADVSATQLPPHSDITRALAFGDVDGDGDPDLVVGNTGQDRLYLNRGGVFSDATSAWLPPDNDTTGGLALADFDRDGDLDLLRGCGSDYYPTRVLEQTRLYLNLGTRFVDATATHLPVDNVATSRVAVGDVDRDGDLDVMLAILAGQNRLYSNQGNGTFTDATAVAMPVDQDDAWDVALGDVDGDGHLDATFAVSAASGGSGEPTLYLNAGNGTFLASSPTRLPFPGNYGVTAAHACAMVDLDDDGDLDIAYATRLAIARAGYNPRYYPGLLLENDGRGFFRDATESGLRAFHLPSYGLAVGDLDGDLDADLVFGGFGNRTVVLANLRRHLHAPLPARLAAPFALELHASGSSIAGYPLGVGAISLLGFDPPLPIPGLGTLGVDPSAAIWLDPLTLKNAEGRATLSFEMPALSSLVNATLHYQALVLHAPQPSTWRLTNAGLAIIHS
ncbi:MAG: VCBS repeat-containing protein [Planctomycetes bacterium]|nr:VCBS repeat-containing protein [Planctomycetota bacterium]